VLHRVRLQHGGQSRVVNALAVDGQLFHKLQQRVKISGESGSSGNCACKSVTSFAVRSLLQPNPFASTGRVATAQNSIKFCGVR